MYTVVIADDDANIREGLGSLIDWEEYGFSIVATAGNGRTALRVVEALDPDLLIADVRMPGMDGLSLIKSIRAAGRTTHCLIISAYDEFAYAKQALAFGVENYLLKPVDPDELRESLVAIAGKAGDQAPTYLFADGLGQDDLRSHILRRLLSGAVGTRELDERVGVVGLHRRQGPYRCVTLRCGTADADALKPVLRGAGTIWGSHHAVSFADETGLVVVILSDAVDSAQIAEEAARLLELGGADQRPVVAVIGRDTPRLATIHHSYADAKQASDVLFAHPVSQVIDGSVYAGEPHSGIDRESLMRALATADRTALDRFFDDLADRFGGTREHAVLAGISKTVGGTYGEFVVERDIGWNRLLGDRPRPLHASYPETADAELLVLQDVGRRIVAHVGKGSSSPQDTGVRLVREVRRRITDPALYLKAVAEDLGISPAYAGSLFYEETGLHFSHYVNKRRVMLAIERIEKGATSTSRIAHAVGYADPKYFSKVFKRITGHSPSTHIRDHSS